MALVIWLAFMAGFGWVTLWGWIYVNARPYAWWNSLAFTLLMGAQPIFIFAALVVANLGPR